MKAALLLIAVLSAVACAPQDGASEDSNTKSLATGTATNDFQSSQTSLGYARRPSVGGGSAQPTEGTPDTAELDRRERELTQQRPPAGPPLPDSAQNASTIDARRATSVPPTTNPGAQ